MSVWSYRLGSSSLFTRTNEGSTEPKRVVFLSVEGTKTEVQYLHFIEKYRVELKINALVHIEVLKRFDTKSDPENVLELLEEYIQFRENKMFENNIDSLCLKDYSTEFIKSYLEDDSCLTKKERRKFEAALREEQLDLLYLDFLGKYKGKDDAFGIVIDRDCGSHTAEQMKKVVEKCKQKEYLYYITNPCIEFWQGLLISEYPPGTKPARYNFPKRNRLISAWSDKLIIIGPGKGSGSLITGDYAKKYGREIEIIS